MNITIKEEENGMTWHVTTPNNELTPQSLLFLGVGIIMLTIALRAVYHLTRRS